MDKNASTTLLARARPDHTGFWLCLFILTVLIVLLGLSLFIPASPGEAQRSADIIIPVACGLLLGVPSILAIVWTFRAEVRADEKGLRWRGLWHGWRECRWDEINDYYGKLLSTDHSGADITEVTILTAHGKIVCGSKTFNVSDLRQTVETHATQARAKSWRILGTSPDLDWPKTFTYRTGSNTFFRVMFAMLFACSAGMLVMGLKSLPQDIAPFGHSVIAVDLGMTVFGVLPIGMYTSIFVPLVIDTFRRRNETITVSESGIAWSNRGDTIQIKWNEITDYHTDCLSNRFKIGLIYVLQTDQSRLVFTPTIREAKVLKRIVQEFATSATSTEWKMQGEKDAEILGGRTSCWSSGYEGMGDRIYHYRNRTHRAMTWFCCIFPCLPLFTEMLYLCGIPVTPPNPWLLVASIAILMYIWWRYTIGGVRTNDTGITQATLLGKRYIAWDDVQDYRMSGQEGFQVLSATGSKSKIQFWELITDLEELKAEITRRAVNCPHGTWETATTPKQGKLTT